MSKRVIELVDYDPKWVKIFETERLILANIIGSNAIHIEHIGSTAVVGLMAKPVIDILIEVNELTALDTNNKAFIEQSYIVKGENGISGRRYYEKGGNQRSHHVHVFQNNDINLLRHRAFKEYLVAHPAIASAYGKIKKEALARSGNDINNYMALKNDFITKHETLAIQWFVN